MMTVCLDEARASAFVAGDLPIVARASIEEHVDDCGSCRQLLAALVRRTEAAGWVAGTRVRRYVVRERIGRGAMGTVYRADDLELDRPVALKRLGVVDAGGDANMLLREARAAAQLSHANVVTVHEVGEENGVPFLAMELVDGTTLTGWLRAERRSWREIIAVLAQAGRGLAAAHERGLVHRDFKPDNVLVDRKSRARVADFGLARVAPTPIHALGSPGLARSTAGLAGTPAYLAPELIDGAAPDARSDQYAYGIALYEALHGEHPFAGATAEQLWIAMAAGDIRDGRGRVPAWLDRHVRRALAVDPAARWPSVDALVLAIERGPRRRWPWLAAAAVVAANAVLVARLVTPAVEPCAARAVDRAWNPVARTAQLAQLLGAAPSRTSSIASTGALVDDWAERWRFGEEAACRVGPAQRVARQSCLDHGLAELRAQLATWQSPTLATVDHAVAAAAELPRPDDCATPPPIAHASPALLDRMARLGALARDGRDQEALPAIAGVLADAEATADPETIAQAFEYAGRLERDVGRRAEAHDHDARAAREAARAGDDRVTLAALLAEAELAIDLGSPGEALALCDAADAVVSRGHLDHAYRPAVVRADALGAAGRAKDAIAGYRSALVILEPLAAREHSARLDYAAVLGALGDQLGEQYNLEEAIATLHRGLAIEEVELGANHPEVAKTLGALAQQERAAGHVADAREHLTRARAIFAAGYGEHATDVALVDIGLGEVAMSSADWPLARRQFELARGEAKDLPPDHPTFSAIETSLAECAKAEDHEAEAAELFGRAVAIEEHAHRRGVALADAYLNQAMVLFDLSRFAEARTAAERGLAEHEQAGSAPAGRVNGWIVLSELEANAGHGARAIAYATQVVDALDDPNNAGWVAVRDHERARIAELSK